MKAQFFFNGRTTHSLQRLKHFQTINFDKRFMREQTVFEEA
jgi:hypothetical protein